MVTTINLPGKMETFSGRYFLPLTPRPVDVSIIDIAESHSKTCRFRGMCRGFYSVAQHSVHVSERVPKELAMKGLLHDADEPYLFDAVATIKPFIWFYAPEVGLDKLTKIKMISEEILACVATNLDISLTESQIVKSVDLRMLATEARDLMPSGGKEWHLPPPYDDLKINCWPWELARERFLARFQSLRLANL